jgi:two-component system, OmpR family, heavy metal sensor histidine kinase CusS
MRSIRLSLVIYFLGILALALGAVSILVYRTTERNLQAKQKAMSDLLRAQHQAKLDEILLEETRKLADEVKLQAEQRSNTFTRLHAPLGLLSAPFGTTSLQSFLLWSVQLPPPERSPAAGANKVVFGPPGPEGGPPEKKSTGPKGWGGPRWGLAVRVVRDLQFAMMIMTGPKFKVKDTALALQPDQLIQFVQINSQHGAEWHSPSMGERSFGFHPDAFAGPRLVHWTYDNTSLGSTPVRRLSLKVANFAIDWGAPPRVGTARVQFRGPLFPVKWDGKRPPPTIYVQAAYNRSRTDGVLGKMQEGLDQTLARLEESNQETLGALGQDLLLLNGAAFAAAFLGVFLLVRLGLAPLRKLSDAVSQVSEKHFRLPLDGARMPGELRPIVQRLGQTLGLLERAFAREKQAAADISHELRTPLAALLTTLEVALRKPRAGEEYREILEEARASGQHMYGLVERLLALARLDAGADHLRPRAVDVRNLAEQCASLVRPLAEARGLSLQVRTNGPACVTADPDKLREVFTNLLHNAIEYNRPQGSIEVSVARHNGEVDVEVKDTGIGIAPEARQHIFERFYRSDPSRQSEGLHAGLGLAIVKGYVDLMGGKIDVESVQGEGSTFRVHLPAQADSYEA